MATIDIRNLTETKVDRIVFEDEGASRPWSFAHTLCYHSEEDSTFRITDNCNDYVRIVSKEHAKNLIKAIKKAIELGWVT